MNKLKTLYRPVGIAELELIVDSGMKEFPPRLFWQPIFYPVLNIEYAIEIAERWNRGTEDSADAGFVTSFDILEKYFDRFAIQTVGLKHHQELWVPADELANFNTMIQNGIRIEKAFIGQKCSLPSKIADLIDKQDKL
jgi:hypothetical protein